MRFNFKEEEIVNIHNRNLQEILFSSLRIISIFYLAAVGPVLGARFREHKSDIFATMFGVSVPNVMDEHSPFPAAINHLKNHFIIRYCDGKILAYGPHHISIL